MKQYQGLTAKQALEKHRIKTAVRGMTLALCAGLTWAFQGVIITLAQSYFPFASAAYTMWMVVLVGLVVASIHDFFGGCWLFLYNCATHRRPEYLRTMKSKAGKIIFIAAFFGGVLAMGGNMVAYNFVGVSYVLAIAGTFPAISAILSVIFLKEKLTLRTTFGICLVVAGAVLVSWSPPDGTYYPHFYVGIFFAVICAIGFGSDTVTAAYGIDMVDPNIATGIRDFASCLWILILPISIVGFATHHVGFAYKLFASGLICGLPTLLILLAALWGGTSYLVNYCSMNLIGAARGTALNGSFALWSIPVSFLFQALGVYEFALTKNAIFGAVMIFLGVVFVVANPREFLSFRKH